MNEQKKSVEFAVVQLSEVPSELLDIMLELQQAFHEFQEQMATAVRLNQKDDDEGLVYREELESAGAVGHVMGLARGIIISVHSLRQVDRFMQFLNQHNQFKDIFESVYNDAVEILND